MSTTTAEHWITEPDGLGTATLVLSVVFSVLCIAIVSIRTWIRLQLGTFSVDDGLMIVGLGFFVACAAFTSMAVYTGLGTVDERLTAWNSGAATKNIVFFQMTYAWSLPFIKSSICLTMLRIITQKSLRITIWICMVASIVSAMVGFVSVIALCQPLTFYWDTTVDGGWCAPTSIITAMSYLVSAAAIVTDWICALVPCFVVWQLQMKARLKASVCGVLALGIIASAATVIRLPYLPYYNITTNYFYNVANIVLWSIVECGVGIVAGSMPSLRSLLKSWIDKSTEDSNYKNNPSGYGPGKGSSNLSNTKKMKTSDSVKMGYMTPKNRGNTTLVSAARAEGNWMELDDDKDSQKHIIHQTFDVSVDISENRSFRN